MNNLATIQFTISNTAPTGSLTFNIDMTDESENNWTDKDEADECAKEDYKASLAAQYDDHDEYYEDMLADQQESMEFCPANAHEERLEQYEQYGEDYHAR